MKDEEKNLIENLFNRLKNTELNSSERDQSADDLIQQLVKRQPASSYYMTQTILIQETAIKKMSATIEELKKRIEKLSKKPSFLSSFFKSNPSTQKISHDENIWKNKENIGPLQNSSNVPMSSPIATQITPMVTTRSSGFLSNALQTATGVAGGMILGNMLMNVFNHSKPEDEIFDNINKSSLDHDTTNEHLNEHLVNNTHDNLVNYEENESDIHTNESNFDFISNKDELNHADYTDDTDINDDNFI